MATETISVPEIRCDHCQRSIEGALRPLGGVASAEVDVDARTVTVSYDESSVSRSELVGAVEAQGYEVQSSP
jgi:copper chaperone